MGPLMEYATLREYLAQNIKNVLWIYYEGNDFKDLGNELKSELLKNYLLDERYKQNLKSKQSDINLLGKELILVEEEAYLKNMTRKDKILNFIKLVKLRLYFERRNNVSTQSKPQPEFKKILRLVKDLTEKNNSNLFFVYLPEWNRYQKNYSDQNYNYIKKLVNSLNIPFIDIHSEVFLKEKNPLELFPFKLDGHHYTVKSYKKIGSAIFKFVNNQK